MAQTPTFPEVPPIKTPTKTKVSVIREEYISITDRFEQALILNQFIYWSERVKDFDQFIVEENKRKDMHGLQEEMEEPTHGWIYKTASQLADELMTGWSPATIGRHLKPLIDIGFLEVRQNPKYKWNQTRQYRVNLNAVGQALYEKGFSIPGYSLIQFSDSTSPYFKMKNEDVKVKNVHYTETTTEIKNDVLLDVTDPSSAKTKTSSSFSCSKKEQPTTSTIDAAIDALVLLVPEAMRKPSVVAKIAKAVESGMAISLIESCIAYSNKHSDQKTWQRYRSHLGRCIDEKWGEGFTKEDAEADDTAKEQAFIESRRGMPIHVLKIDAAKGCKISQKVLEERKRGKPEL